MDTELWLSLPQTIEKSKKQYAHFDFRTDLSKCADYVKDPNNIATHSFYPFIHYKKKMIKYFLRKDERGKKVKERDICYAAHIDRCILQYYSFLLNQLYNRRLRTDNIYHVPVAYRTDLHENNIKTSKKAFDFMRSNPRNYIMIGDFTKFFDRLDHNYLKKQWCSLLNSTYLPADHYNIFKNITRYSWWELDDLLHLNGLTDTKSNRQKLNKRQTVLTREQFHKNRSHIQRNKYSYGIPQGSPISALLANVYMLDVDRYINQVVTSYCGLYMRYSDDFIIVLPLIDENAAIKTLSELTSYLNTVPGLTLEPDKTQYYLYDNGQLENCGKRFHADADTNKRFVNFLGFTFDGNRVSIRSKTISKYYYKMYRKAKTITKNSGYTSNGTKISGENLYKHYSIDGAKSKNGNFISYVLRAADVYKDDQFFEQITKRHKQKIRKALKRGKMVGSVSITPKRNSE